MGKSAGRYTGKSQEERLRQKRKVARMAKTEDESSEVRSRGRAAATGYTRK